ncbi:unnamed protein product [Blepharisma stoltei]|uniref:Uncharacterized protein n=1 Tax=Blepharisma stoltei TaxID=1481888 RepID=A0AAU9JKH8_9CILI|nr:unnamed protein product [Blepharisma stoltei]
MEDLLLKNEYSQQEVLRKAISDPQSLPTYIWELEKLLSQTNQRINVLASQYHHNILDHQSNLQEIGVNLKSLLKKARFLQSQSQKMSREMSESYDKICECVRQLERVQEASELIRNAQQFFFKIKKNKNKKSPEIEELAQSLRGVKAIEKLMNN